MNKNCKISLLFLFRDAAPPASKALDEIYKIYHPSVPSAPFDSNLKTKKSASGKRPPDAAHGSGDETIRPQQCSEAWGKQRKEGAQGTLLCQGE